MKLRPAATILAALLVSFLVQEGSSEGQGQRYKLGGGAGFASLKDPEFDIGSTAIVGGFFGFRFNDTFSFEAGGNFVRANREYNENGVPLDKVSGGPVSEQLPALRLETNRYHADGTLVIHIGRRQPFHPFVLAGGGVVRRDEKQTALDFTLDEDTGAINRGPETVILNTTEYNVTGHAGAGFDFYFLYNVAARAEFRVWLPQEWEKRTRMFFFAATYFF
jgi:hypothetical protein